MKVATIQFAPVYGNKRLNLSKMRALATKAAQAGAKLIVLPELSTSGYSMMSTEAAKEMADYLGEMTDLTTSSLSVMAGVVKQFGCAIVWGCIEADPGTGKVYNSQVFLERTADDG